MNVMTCLFNNEHKNLFDEKYNSETLAIFLGWNQRKLETKTEQFYLPNFIEKFLWKIVSKLAEILMYKLYDQNIMNYLGSFKKLEGTRWIIYIIWLFNNVLWTKLIESK